MSDFDLVIIGSGSGNSLVTDHFAGKRVAIIEDGVFGGTCLNVGCIPTKMFVYPAYVASAVRHAGRLGVDATVNRVRWADIRDRIFGRIDPISAAGERYRRDGENTTLITGHAEFTGPDTVRVGQDEIRAPQIVIATGARPVIPQPILDSGVDFHTSDTIMRIDDLPRHLLVLGGGYIAAEMAGFFSAFGVQVSVVNRGAGLLREQDADIAAAFTACASKAWDVRLGVTVTTASQQGGDITLTLSDGSQLSGDCLLVATGRTPNSDGLGLDEAGVAVRPDGRIQVDSFGRTTAAGIWSLGDASSPYQLKHVANHEARVVAHNLAHPDDLRSFDHRFVPAAVFTEPQIASIGLTEAQAREQGLDFVTAIHDYGDTAYGWAMEDEHGICKLIADRGTGLLLGAHLMGHEASALIQPLIGAMSFGQPVAEFVRGQYWIHPALPEVVENALLKLDLH
jgi:mycothione reductase